MTHPHECQLIYSPLSNLSLWINKAIRSIRKISTSMFATRHLCGVTYGIENLQRNHCACTLEIARRGVGWPEWWRHSQQLHYLLTICIDVLHHCKVYLNMYVNYSLDDILNWTALWREILVLCATEISNVYHYVVASPAKVFFTGTNQPRWQCRCATYICFDIDYDLN